jgi:hypothetical protein
MNRNQGIFPSLKRRGGCGINQISRSYRIAAAGVASSAKAFRPKDFAGLTTIYASRYRARASPSARTKVASRYFLTAYPPLLFKEGNMLVRQFIHIFTDRAYSLWIPVKR